MSLTTSVLEGERDYQKEEKGIPAETNVIPSGGGQGGVFIQG